MCIYSLAALVAVKNRHMSTAMIGVLYACPVVQEFWAESRLRDDIQVRMCYVSM